MAKWAGSAPDDFKFTFKIWKGVTHNKGLIFIKQDVFDFFEAINAVGEKKCCLLIQLPPGLGAEYHLAFVSLLRCIQEANPGEGWKVAVEFRHPSWYQSRTYELLQSYNTSLVIQDMPRSATPDVHHFSDMIYIRFHGPTGNYRESYSEAFLEEYATYILEWIEEGKTVCTYFNNTLGEAFNNLLTLQQNLQEKISVT